MLFPLIAWAHICAHTFHTTTQYTHNHARSDRKQPNANSITRIVVFNWFVRKSNGFLPKLVFPPAATTAAAARRLLYFTALKAMKLVGTPPNWWCFSNRYTYSDATRPGRVFFGVELITLWLLSESVAFYCPLSSLGASILGMCGITMGNKFKFGNENETQFSAHIVKIYLKLQVNQLLIIRNKHRAHSRITFNLWPIVSKRISNRMIPAGIIAVLHGNWGRLK